MNNPPEEQLFESGTQEVEQCDHVDAALDMSEDEQSASASNPQKQEKKIVRASRSKKALSDVIEKSNEQMGNITNFIASSIVSPEVREKERKEDREFFGQMFSMLSQTMIGISQMHQNYPHQYFPHAQQPFQPPAFFGINHSETLRASYDTVSHTACTIIE